MVALRASDDVDDVSLERKLGMDYTKLKSRVELQARTRYAPVVPAAMGSGQAMTRNPPSSTTIGEKRFGSQEDPCRDV